MGRVGWKWGAGFLGEVLGVVLGEGLGWVGVAFLSLSLHACGAGELGLGLR